MMPEQIVPSPKRPRLAKRLLQIGRMPILDALNISIEFGTRSRQARPDGERSILQILIHMARLPPRSRIGRALPGGRPQPNLPPNQRRRQHPYRLRRTIRLRPHQRHINHVYFGWLSRQQLQMSSRRSVAQQKDLPGWSQFLVGESLLNRGFASLPEGMERVPCGWQCGALGSLKDRSQSQLQNFKFLFAS